MAEASGLGGEMLVPEPRQWGESAGWTGEASRATRWLAGLVRDPRGPSPP